MCDWGVGRPCTAVKDAKTAAERRVAVFVQLAKFFRDIPVGILFVAIHCTVYRVCVCVCVPVCGHSGTGAGGVCCKLWLTQALKHTFSGEQIVPLWGKLREMWWGLPTTPPVLEVESAIATSPGVCCSALAHHKRQ